ncbi:DNA-directed RNA polymerase subunit omega [Luteibaculum oceani]|uniref:DNA-directed RNA polymerase subunit omega n=1 Tax=Luteibaculum oceani TaxID=1294296 RepID=A0A5C6US49_9FLAO|nr:DNA-directed RNA polymerase subunit omega [Luteibaculum oceani]TXC76152.1 DNA-directed RNA polymerase subunit omega [Luteibaculum oceani]
MAVDFKNSNAERTTVTRNLVDLEDKTGNIYESIVVVSKRANQLSKILKEELTSKLSEFATTSDNLEEVFENREQIEISRFYEKLPKPHSIAFEEMLEGNTYFRKVEEEEEKPSIEL